MTLAIKYNESIAWETLKLEKDPYNTLLWMIMMHVNPSKSDINSWIMCLIMMQKRKSWSWCKKAKERQRKSTMSSSLSCSLPARLYCLKNSNNTFLCGWIADFPSLRKTSLLFKLIFHLIISLHCQFLVIQPFLNIHFVS